MKTSCRAGQVVVGLLAAVLGCQGRRTARDARPAVDVAACVAYYRSISSPALTMHQFAADPKLVGLLLDVDATRETVKGLLADKDVSVRSIGVMIAAASGDPGLYPAVSKLYKDAKTDADMGRIDVMGDYSIFTAAMQLDRDKALSDLALLAARPCSPGYTLPPRAIGFLDRWYQPGLLLVYVPSTGEYRVAVAKVPGYWSNEIGDRAAVLVEEGQLSATQAEELWFEFGDDRVADIAARRIASAIASWRRWPQLLHDPVNEIGEIASYYKYRRDHKGTPYLILSLEMARKHGNTSDPVFTNLLMDALLAATKGDGPEDATDWRGWYERECPGELARVEAQVNEIMEQIRVEEEGE